jgi:hypothetical protein
MDTLEILLWAFVVFLGARIFLQLSNTRLEAELEERQGLIKKLNDVIHVVKEEKYGDVTYWFDQDNDQFLAQGRNIEEIKEHVKQRFHKHVFLINDTQMLASSKETNQYELMSITKLLNEN